MFQLRGGIHRLQHQAFMMLTWSVGCCSAGTAYQQARWRLLALLRAVAQQQRPMVQQGLEAALKRPQPLRMQQQRLPLPSVQWHLQCKVQGGFAMLQPSAHFGSCIRVWRSTLPAKSICRNAMACTGCRPERRAHHCLHATAAGPRLGTPACSTTQVAHLHADS